MTDFSQAFRLDKMRSGNPAVYILKEQFESFATSPRRVDVCESIARCFYQLEQYEDAANWYETAGLMILSEPITPNPVRALAALEQYEKALDCYGRLEDDDAFSECSGMVRQLRRVCASA